jgi:chemotaxis signal transduction protein
VVAIDVDDRTIGLAVDAVIGVRDIEHDALHHLSPLLEGACGGAIIAVGALGAELLFVLQDSALVPASLWGLLAGHSPI